MSLRIDNQPDENDKNQYPRFQNVQANSDQSKTEENHQTIKIHYNCRISPTSSEVQVEKKLSFVEKLSFLVFKAFFRSGRQSALV